MARSSSLMSYMQRRTSLSVATFMFPVSIDGSEIVQSVSILAKNTLSSYSEKSPTFQRKNYRSLVHTIHSLVIFSEHVKDSDNVALNHLNHTTVTCFSELYILLDRARDLLKYCLESSRLRLLLLNSMMSSYFHHLDREILCVLDVIPLKKMELNEDVIELLELLKKQLERRQLFVDATEESLKIRIFEFYKKLQGGMLPNDADLRKYFVQDLGMADTNEFTCEIKSLELVTTHEAEASVPDSVLKALACLMRYSNLLIFGVQEEITSTNGRDYMRKDEATQMIVKTFITEPPEFVCPISHELMTDPIILASGQTFERDSIIKWFQNKDFRCPVTRMKLSRTALIPNLAIKSLISIWCAAQGTPFNAPPTTEAQEELRRNIVRESSTMAILEVNRATAKLLLDVLLQGSESAKRIAVAELRLLTECGKEICMDITNGCGVPIFIHLINSEYQDVQENAAISILNLSLLSENKILISDVEGFIKSILNVVKSGHTEKAREYAAATICSLSMAQQNKEKLAKTSELLTTLLKLLKEGSPVGRQNAMNTLKNLAILDRNRTRLIKAGSTIAMVKALETAELRQQAADVLAFLVRKPLGAKELRKERSAVTKLANMLEWGDPSEKESAAKALLMFFLHGGSIGMQRAFQHSVLKGLIPYLLRSDLVETRSRAAKLIRLHEQLHRMRSDIVAESSI